MGRPNPCLDCETAEHLQWKTFAEKEWWIHCDGCGKVSQAKPDQTAAGEQWNLENPNG